MIYQYFQSNANGHSRSNAYLLALLSYYIYANETPRPPGAGATFNDRFKATFSALSDPDDPFKVDVWTNNIEFAILSTSKLVLVVYRGSESLFSDPGDWLPPAAGSNFPADMKIAPPSWGALVRVHRGFYDSMQTTYQIVRNEVRSRFRRGARLFLTGHSRGGSIATLCAYNLQREGIHVSGLYTFGGTRVGDQRFRDVYNGIGLGERTFRWVRNNDAGPKWPDVDGSGGIPHPYFHVGRRNFIADNGRVTMNAVEPNIPIPIFSVGDHDMFIYCSLMYLQLSNTQRTGGNAPHWLVKRDVANGLPHLSPGLFG